MDFKTFIKEMLKTDKMAHLGVGGLICAIIALLIGASDLQFISESPFRLVALPITGTVFVFIISVIKEFAVDSEFSILDIAAAMVGCLLIFITMLICSIIILLS